jgi:predicted transcriptional regulator
LLPHFPTSRVAILKHLKVLERAELILSQRVGRTRRLYINLVPIQVIYERWATEFSSLWAGQLTQLKYKIETRQSPTVPNRKKKHG